jgi:hypothetical protein
METEMKTQKNKTPHVYANYNFKIRETPNPYGN